jgi:hypothetical protein
MPVLRVQAPGRAMSDFSFSIRCPFCGGRYAPDDGSCCEPPDEEGGEEGRGVGPDDGIEESHRPLTTARLQALRRVGTLLRKREIARGVSPFATRATRFRLHPHLGYYWGSAPPPQAKPAEPPRSNSLTLVYAAGSAPPPTA